MKRLAIAWVVLAVLAAALFAWERALVRADDAERVAIGRIGRMIPAPQREAVGEVAVVSVGGLDPGDRFHYVRLEGFWRCLEHHQAVGSGEAIEALIQSLLEAEGVVKTRDPVAARNFGFDTPTMWRVELHGPDFGSSRDARDVRLAVDVGTQVPGTNGCYLRPTATGAVWAVDTNPWSALARARMKPGPPLLDPSLLPRGWPAEKQRLERIAVHPVGEEPYELKLERVEISEEEYRRGKSPWLWKASRAGRAIPVEPAVAMSFSGFLYKAPYEAVLDPARAGELGVGTPRGRVVLLTNDGDACELRIGAEQPDGQVVVANLRTNCVYLVTAEVAELLAPSTARLAGPDDPFAPLVRAATGG